MLLPADAPASSPSYPALSTTVNGHVMDIHILPKGAASAKDLAFDAHMWRMMDKMSKEGFKHEIQKREKKFKKTSEIRDVIQMFVHTSDDLFRQMLVNDTYQEVVETLKNLKGYMNDSLKHISKRYNCVVPYLGNTRNVFVKGRANDIN
jgi:hypothetical protein